MRIVNKRARHNYLILKKYEAGLSLTGDEVRAIKIGRVDLSRAYAKPIGEEIFLINANLGLGKEPTRSRKLLLHKKEIKSIQSLIKAKKLTLVPLKMYTQGRLIKLELGLGKAKKKHAKKAELKKKDLEREIKRHFKGTTMVSTG